MSKILVTGGSGMIGSAIQKVAPEATYLSSLDCNLIDSQETFKLFEKIKPEKVIHLAARVGGVKANTDYVGDFFYENTMINTNVLEACRRSGVQKVVSLLSTCIFPAEPTYPLTEEQVHNGVPHESNFGYAFAKRMLDVQSRAYRKQYGCNFVTAIPNNIFGEQDNYDLENGHVVPAMIRKIYEAKESGGSVYLWGDGTPLREFTYSLDLANILMFVMENYEEETPINVGNPNEYTIKDIALVIAKILDYEGKIVWQTDKPAGQYRKPSSNKKLLELGWDSDYTSLEDAMRRTCGWFLEHYPNVRGVNN